MRRRSSRRSGKPLPDTGEHRISLTIGTAGHVDHGKTTLVRYMTGTDTDRLEEEHRRGISIVPGYAKLDLPSGRRASLVDVPGHERFVKNMVSGATGVDAFLLVVAADDGVMPQTREHLDVLRVLGIEQGVVALSKIDAVDDDTAELAALEVEDLLESLEITAPVVPVSGATGEGVDDLLLALDELAVDPATRRDGLARLPVDRAFVLKGIGVVVTGTLWSGEVRPGDVLYTQAGLRPRVRGVQNHGHPAEVAYARARSALDLTGVGASEIEGGDVLLSHPVPASRDLDVRLRLLEGAKPFAHGMRVRLHHGTRSTNARVRLTSSEELRPGESTLARLKLAEPIVALPGDRFVLRSLAPQVTVGGGTVLDPAPTGRRPDPTWLEALESGDATKFVPLALARKPMEGMTTGELSLVLAVPPEEISRAVETSPEVETLGEDLQAPVAEVAAARNRLLEALKRRAVERPESPELSVAEARTATGLSARLANALLANLEIAEVKTSETGIGLAGVGGIPPELEQDAQALLDELRAAGAQPPALEPTPALRLLLKRGEAVDLGGSLFAASEAADEVLTRIKAVCLQEGKISLAGLRDCLGTTRKYAQAWLEYSDAAGVTSRTGDVRILTRRHRKAM
jgi:selenocysteine-specific elongation factor